MRDIDYFFKHPKFSKDKISIYKFDNKKNIMILIKK